MLKRLCLVLTVLFITLFAAALSFGQTVTINSNFNGTPIAAGNYIYFNVVVNVSRLSTTEPTILDLAGPTMTFAGRTVNLPGATIKYDPAATTVSTTYGLAGWTTVVPINLSGNQFITAFPYQVPAGGLPGGINPVVFTGDFSSNRPGVSGNVKFAAAVYTSMPTDLNQLNVNPVDDSHFGTIGQAGTPQNYISYVIGGARGGGGSNYTGSYSSTASFTTTCCGPGPSAAMAAVSGRVLTYDGVGLRGATVSLVGLDGVPHSAVTSPFGYYSIEDVEAGRSYLLTVSAKGYIFNPVVLTVSEDLGSMDIYAIAPALTSSRSILR